MMGPGVQIFRSRNRFTGASGQTLTLTSPAAASVPLTINAHASQSGDLILIQEAAGQDRWRMHSGFTLMGINAASGTQPTVTSPVGFFEGRANAVDVTSCTINLRNYNAGVAGARYNVAADACSGWFGAVATGGTSPSSAAADSIVLALGSDAASLQCWASGAAQTVRWYVGSGTETMRISETACLRLGGSLTTALAKFQVVGQADEIQCVLRGNSSQTADLLVVEVSGGADVFRVGPTGVAIGASGALILKHLSGTATWDPASLLTMTQTTTTVTVTGAALGDTVCVGFSNDLQALQLTGYVSATNTVTVVLQNGTAGTVDLASGTIRCDVWQH